MSGQEAQPVVVLVGPPASGKSTIARRLGHALHLPVIDTDDLIAEREGKPCGEVLSTLGEPEFRRIEEQAIADALHIRGIVALGGGAVISERTRAALMDHMVVYLHVTAEEGFQRTSGNQSRPLLNVDDPAEAYRKLLEERQEFYEEVASFRVRSGSSDPQRVTTSILQYLEDSAPNTPSTECKSIAPNPFVRAPRPEPIQEP